jgi:hypothetical protein
MTYVIRRPNNDFPVDPIALESNMWYNIWRINSRPFNMLQINDTVLIKVGENSFREAKIPTLVKHHFSCRDGLMSILTAFSYYPHEGDPYWVGKLDIQVGVLPAYKFSDIQDSEMIDSNTITWFGNGWGVINQ